MAVKEVSGGMLVIYSWGISCEFCWKCYTSENCFGKCCCQFIFLACIYFCLYMTKLNMNYCSKFHVFLQKIDVMNAILFTQMFLFDKKKIKRKFSDREFSCHTLLKEIVSLWSCNTSNWYRRDLRSVWALIQLTTRSKPSNNVTTTGEYQTYKRHHIVRRLLSVRNKRHSPATHTSFGK